MDGINILFEVFPAINMGEGRYQQEYTVHEPLYYYMWKELVNPPNNTHEKFLELYKFVCSLIGESLADLQLSSYDKFFLEDNPEGLNGMVKWSEKAEGFQPLTINEVNQISKEIKELYAFYSKNSQTDDKTQLENEGKQVINKIHILLNELYANRNLNPNVAAKIQLPPLQHGLGRRRKTHKARKGKKVLRYKKTKSNKRTRK